MERVQKTVDRFIACDGMEFDGADKCLAHEREQRSVLYAEIQVLRMNIKELKRVVTEAMMRARLAKIDADSAMLYRSAGLKAKREWHEKMIAYYDMCIEARNQRGKLREARRGLSIKTDYAYQWFGDLKRKSSIAKLERRKKSLMWRRDNTPDKWRTPNKIRVNKLPKEEQQ